MAESKDAVEAQGELLSVLLSSPGATCPKDKPKPEHKPPPPNHTAAERASGPKRTKRAKLQPQDPGDAETKIDFSERFRNATDKKELNTKELDRATENKKK